MSDDSSKAWREYARCKRNLWWSIGCVAYGGVCMVAASPPRELREFVRDQAILFLLSGAGGFVAIVVGAVMIYVNTGAKREAWREYRRVVDQEIAQRRAAKQGEHSHG